MRGCWGLAAECAFLWCRRVDPVSVSIIRVMTGDEAFDALWGCACIRQVHINEICNGGEPTGPCLLLWGLHFDNSTYVKWLSV